MNTKRIESGSVRMIAHRGLSGIERENTCPAFVAAANRSYYGIETDVHVTKDGEFIIIHDETLERVTLKKHKINVEKSNYADIENIILPDIDGNTDRKDIRIPLLKEYISICKKYEKVCVLELKNHFDENDLDRLIEEIKSLDYIDNVIFISFDFDNCVNVRKRLKNNTVQWLTGPCDITVELMNKLKEYNLDIDINYKKLNCENIKLLHLNGIKVNCWTCDDETDAGKLISWGVDYITTNILE